MKLYNGTIRPGVVKEILPNGCIKATAPGLFNSVDDTNFLPPIMPWQIGSNANSYSQPEKQSEVWIMNFDDNPMQLYWFRKDDITECDNLDLTEINVEVLCNKDLNGEWATIYLSDGSGWVISKGESVMQIRADGSITLTNGLPQRTIDINVGGISLGKAGSSSHQAAYGDVIIDIFLSLLSLLKQVQMAAMANPHTMQLASPIAALLPNIEKMVPALMSDTVSLE